MKLPQKGGWPQSMEQLNWVSNGGSQTKLPQTVGPLQSEGHVNCVSPGSQMKLPQMNGLRQSVGQLNCVSPGSHSPLPQNDVWQSIGHVKGLSGGWQMRSPHFGLQKGGGGGPPGSGTHGPQSCGHVSEFSLESQKPLPQ
jgi:hypothetical protein